MVTSTFASFANCMARVLFIVDKPPLDDPHSLARRVTCSTKGSGRVCAVLGDDDGVHAFCIATKFAYYKIQILHLGESTFLNESLQNMLTRHNNIIAQQQSKTAHLKRHGKKLYAHCYAYRTITISTTW